VSLDHGAPFDLRLVCLVPPENAFYSVDELRDAEGFPYEGVPFRKPAHLSRFLARVTGHEEDPQRGSFGEEKGRRLAAFEPR